MNAKEVAKMLGYPQAGHSQTGREHTHSTVAPPYGVSGREHTSLYSG